LVPIHKLSEITRGKMIKKDKTRNIFLAIMLLITLNFLFIINGCLNSNSDETVVEQSKSNASHEGDESVTNNNESAVSENTSQETDVSENENNNQADDTESGKEQADSSESNNASSEEEADSLKDIYKRFIESGKPSIIVFSYDADCCPTTKAFFDDYNDMVKKLLKEYKDRFNTLFINIGILDENNMNTAVEIATQNEVLYLPSILILDKTGKAYKVIEGTFNNAEVKKVLDGITDD